MDTPPVRRTKMMDHHMMDIYEVCNAFTFNLKVYYDCPDGWSIKCEEIDLSVRFHPTRAIAMESLANVLKMRFYAWQRDGVLWDKLREMGWKEEDDFWVRPASGRYPSATYRTEGEQMKIYFFTVMEEE